MRIYRDEPRPQTRRLRARFTEDDLIEVLVAHLRSKGERWPDGRVYISITGTFDHMGPPQVEISVDEGQD